MYLAKLFQYNLKGRMKIQQMSVEEMAEYISSTSRQNISQVIKKLKLKGDIATIERIEQVKSNLKGPPSEWAVAKAEREQRSNDKERSAVFLKKTEEYQNSVIIEDFPEYRITETGKVWSIKSNDWLAGGSRNGYNSVSLMRDGKVYYKYVHKLVAETFIANPHNKKCASHIDRDKSNNHVNNIVWGCSDHSFTHSEVESIIKDYKSGITINYIAKRLNRGYDVIRSLIKRKLMIEKPATNQKVYKEHNK